MLRHACLLPEEALDNPARPRGSRLAWGLLLGATALTEAGIAPVEKTSVTLTLFCLHRHEAPWAECIPGLWIQDHRVVIGGRVDVQQAPLVSHRTLTMRSAFAWTMARAPSSAAHDEGIENRPIEQHGMTVSIANAGRTRRRSTSRHHSHAGPLTGARVECRRA